MDRPSLFEKVFGADWAALPQVLRRRYAPRAGSRDLVLLQGALTITMAPWFEKLAPLIKLSRTLAPFSGENIPVVIRFCGEAGAEACDFDRSFMRPDGRTHRFRSRLTPYFSDEMVEYMPAGFAWRASYHWDGARIAIRHRGYLLPLFGRLFPLPFDHLFGRVEAEEEAIDEDRFRMKMRVLHPWLGEIYSYRGEFTVARVERVE
jgi:Domain of unknown function (DUF4166)